MPYDNVYAVGVAAAVDTPWKTPNPVGIPTTGLPTEHHAQVAARNNETRLREVLHVEGTQRPCDVAVDPTG